MRKRPLFLLACVFLTGLAYQRYQVTFLSGIPVFYVCIEIYKGMQNKNFKILAGRSIILLSAFILGMTHMQKEEKFREAYMSKIIDGSQATIWGEIKKIETTDTSIRTILTDCYIRLNEEILPCNDVMVYTSSNHCQVGEIYQITGQLNTFKKPRNLGGFDSLTFYQSQKIDFSIYEKESHFLENQKNGIAKILLAFKGEMEQVYDASLEEKASGFFTAMILGNKTNLDETLKDLFELGGISHVLAISGLHVSIIGRGFYSQLRKRKISFLMAGVLASVLLLAYGYMVGNGMSAVRAVGMMLCYFLAQYWGRSYDMLNALGVMCLLLLWENPFLIEYSGFWFSVTALIGVGYVGAVFSEKVNRGKTFWSCVGITLSTLPVVASCYYEIPLYSSIVNMIVLPILTPLFCVALFVGGMGAGVSMLAQVLKISCGGVLIITKILLTPCAWVLNFYEWLCALVEKLPGASVITGSMSVEQMILYYMVLIAGVFVLRWNLGKERKIILLLCVLCFGIVLFPKEKPFEITFLDVGQGDGIYISSGDGFTYFIDGGSTDIDQVGEYRILPFLKYKGIRKIDYWFVSHADTDHISGLLEVLESGYEVEHLVVAAETPRDENMTALIKVANDAQTKIIYMNVGDEIQSENMVLSCLYPWSISVSDRNDSSMVLYLEAKLEESGQITALFAGDISAEVEAELVSTGLLQQIDVFKVVHHGSKYSNSALFLETISPEIAVVSCGMRNFYGHPHEETIERLENVQSRMFYTMVNGQITVDDMQKLRKE